MFVKKSWNPTTKKKHIQYHIAESYRVPGTNKVRHRLLLNITQLPMHVIESISVALKTGEAVKPGEVSKDAIEIQIKNGDSVRGAGLLSVYRAWKQQKMDGVLPGLTPAEKESVLAMVAQRILEPGSKLSLKTFYVKCHLENRSEVVS
jgi:hypothetical protein